jgi:hypothetical protein
MSRKHKRRESGEGHAVRIDPWHREVEELAARIDPEDDQRLAEAIREIRRQAKEEMRRAIRLS